MSLSANVEALLDVYSRCLGLLHVFGGDKTSKDKPKSKSISKSKSKSTPDALSRSLSSDRAKVVDVFSSRLSESGSRLAKGDGRSRSALRRIVNRLTKVLSGIFSIGTNTKDPYGQLNYDALRALSRSSRVGAIHAIDDLSLRLKRSERGSVASTTSSKTARSGSRLIKPSGSRALPAPTQRPPPTKSKAKEQQLAVVPSAAKTSSHGDRSSKNKSKASKSAGSKAGSSASGRSNRKSKPKEKEAGRAASKTETTASPAQAADTSRYAQASTQTQTRRAVDSVSTVSTTSTARAGPLRTEMHTSDKSALLKHSARPISMLSSSSASTRLGEIPEHKLRRRIAPEPRDGAVGAQESFEYYNISVAYPMRPLWIPEEDTKRKKKDKKEKQKEKEKEKEETGSEKKKHFWGRGRG